MAYDPNDPEDKKIVAKLIADALSAAEEEHEAAVEGLRNKNKELLAKLKKGSEANPEEVEKLEEEVETLKKQLKDTSKQVEKLTRERDTTAAELETERKTSTNDFIDRELTNALVANNVAKQFVPAVKKLLADGVQVKVDGGNRSAVVGDKSLGDFVKAWSQGDDGKHYVAANPNGGGGASGGKADGGSGNKSMPRSQFDGLNHLERAEFAKTGGVVVDG